MVILTPSGKEALDNLVAKVVQDQKLPGFVFGASSVEEDIYFNGGGYNVVNDPASGRVGEHSMFWLCSQTKMVVHLACLMLVEQGEITFESPVADYFPEFANLVVINDQMADVLTYQPARSVMRLKHLLNFTSGLFYPLKGLNPGEQLEAYAASHSKEDPISEFLSIIKGDLPGIPILSEPGESFTYGWSSDIVGFIVEKVSGKSLEEYLQVNIFKPLGMKASFYLTADIKLKLVGLTYRREGNMEAWKNQSKIIEQDPSKVTRHMGGVGLYASLKDYLGLLRHLLQINAGTAKNPILSHESVRSVFEPAPNAALISIDPFAPDGCRMQWSNALAICASDWPGRRKEGTAFWYGWANTFHFMDPTTGVAAVFGTQIIPDGDLDVLRENAEFEKVLYAECHIPTITPVQEIASYLCTFDEVVTAQSLIDEYKNAKRFQNVIQDISKCTM